MVVEFVLWAGLSLLLSRLLRILWPLQDAAALIIAALACALGLCLVLFLRNSRFRRRAVLTQGRVEQLLPPLRTGGLARARVVCTLGDRTLRVTVTPEETPAVGDELPLWVLGRRALPVRPTPLSDFRILALCLAAILLLGSGYLCSLLLPSPKG